MKRLHRQLASVIKRVTFGGFAVLLVVLTPAPYVFADSVGGSTPSANTCTPVASTSGIKSPTGSDASTYTYNSCTGLWENQYYTWSPATQTATPKTPYVYTCNTSTWKWDYKLWDYDPASGKFDQITLSRAQLPSGAIIASGSLTTCAPAAPASITNTGPSSNNSVDSSSSSNATIGSTTNATVSNTIGGTSSTGDAAVVTNTTGGNATSGNATAVANVVNALQSSSSLSGGNVVTFVANVNAADVQGDLIIDPSQLQPASGSNSLTTNTNNLTVNAQTNGTINNDITLNANSGNATVAKNTTGGNATSGNATAIADVINVLNSIISAGKSFVGVININGDFHGNILVPQSFYNELLATNAPSATVNLSEADAANLGITNNVTNTATSGNAAVSNNTSAGSATSGNASTKLTVFNLTGSQIIGSNCLLVFVNVSGTWVGVIMNAPAGTTAAALGGGVSAINTDIAATTNDAINNNINLAAASGNATVADNTKGGSATSGNASTAVNLLNLNNTELNLSGWFGVLFINVFGNWYGNFGVYTPPVPSTTKTGADSAAGNSGPAQGSNKAPVFQFIPASGATNGAVGDSSDTQFATIGAKLASQTAQALGASMSRSAHIASSQQVASNRPLQAVGGILVALGFTALAAERFLNNRRTNHPTEVR